MDAVFSPALLPYKYPCCFPGGGTAILKSKKSPKRPPARLINFTFKTLMENNTVFTIAYPGRKGSIRFIRFPIFNERLTNILSIGKGFNRNP
jgi:hypothetical protein